MAKTKPFDTNLTEAEFKSRIVGALRQASRWWRPKNEAIARARIGRGKYKCEECGTVGPASLPPLPGKKRKRKNIQADHINEVVPITGWVSYDSWIERCFVPADKFQAICWECHTEKTLKENKLRKIIRDGGEVWRELDGYKISNKGTIIGKKGKPLTPIDNGNGYLKVTIGHSKKEYVHRMVAQAFIGDVEGRQVCHKDDNPLNNNANNLFIGTAQDNMNDKIKKGRHIIGGKPILQYDLKGNFIKEWEGGAGEIQRELGFSDNGIYKTCNGEFKQSKGFIWKRKNTN